MVVKDGVDYESLDDEPAELFFMIAAPETGANVHLEALAKLSTILMDTEFKERLVKAETAEQFIRLIDEKEDALDGKNEKIPRAGDYRMSDRNRAYIYGGGKSGYERQRAGDLYQGGDTGSRRSEKCTDG